MRLDLAKLFGVNEEELFVIKTNNQNLDTYYKGYLFIRNNVLMYRENENEYVCPLMFRNIDWDDFEVIKHKELKKINFTNGELFILKCLHSTGLRYLTKDTDEIWLFEEKPTLCNEHGILYWNVEDGDSLTVCIDGTLLLKMITSLPELTCVDLNDYTDEFNKIYL